MTPTPTSRSPITSGTFFSLSPEATHQFTILFSDRGIPASFRTTDGFGSHTFQWVNARGEVFWVKYHFKTDQGIKNLIAEDAARIAGHDADYHQRDLLRAIDRAEYPSWTLKMQIMPAAEAAKYRFNPFDVTKVWSHRDYPLTTVGRIVLNRNPENYFAEVEQAALNPAHFVPGIGPSPDKMLQGRLFSSGDTHRYRLGANHMQLPVNSPHATDTHNYSRNGAMRSDGNHGREKNYEPNSFGGPQQTGKPRLLAVPNPKEVPKCSPGFAVSASVARCPDVRGKLPRARLAAAKRRMPWSSTFCQAGLSALQSKR